ncbi:Aminomethyltransferase [gamma proteobacterium IMCC2047]|nr:Aminomethyltransferase [gamma proteobacterium IMCC2047]
MGNRTSVLESRHQALGATLADWNDMAVAWTYSTDPDSEADATRTAAGLIDLSALRRVHIKGPDAFAAVDYLLPRNMEVIYPGKSGYSTVLTDEGGVADDVIVYRLAEDHFMIAYGTGETVPALIKAVAGKQVSVEYDDDTHIIALQGPIAHTLLDANSPDNIAELKFFHQLETSLFNKPCIVSRTGFTGERGYEIFASADVIGELWDAILEAGTGQGVMPLSFVGLNILRIEAALLFHPFDVSENQTPWEAGLGWSIGKDKKDYIGKNACEAAQGKERMLFSGIIADADVAVGEPIAGSERIYKDGEMVGYVTAALYSTRLQQSIALCYLKPEAAQEGIQVEVKGAINCPATVSALPFYDPEKLKPRGLA